MSLPKMRAVPFDGGWNPRSVWRSVVLPAPFGPRRPTQRPEREAFNPFRIGRFPNWTSRPWSSMTGEFGMIVSPGPVGRVLLDGVRRVHRPEHAAEAGQRAEVQTQGVLVAAREDDAVRLRVGVVERRSLAGQQLAEPGRA